MIKTLNTWTLSGLMVGPILGSGIILLPPLAYARLGPQAVWAWLAVLVLGAGFAAVFIRMALRSQTDAGIAALVAREWGESWGELASNFLTGAVVFGAVPVLLTAGRLWPAELALGLDPLGLAAVLLAVTVLLLLAGLTTVSRLTLALSSLTALCLVVSGVLGLAGSAAFVWPAPAWDPALGPTLLILFWAVVGWEVVGNYTSQVRNPEKTIPRAGLVSLGAVTLVYLATTLGLQTLAPGAAGTPSVATVLGPLFGPLAPGAAGLLAGGLCQVSVLMFMGAVTRMSAQRARQGSLPRWLGEKTPGSTPRKAILVLGTTSSILLGLVAGGAANLEDLVSVANLFFLGNALLGLAAAWKILRTPAWRILILVLGAALGLLLTQGLLFGWLLVGLVTGGTFLRAWLRTPLPKRE